MPQTQATTAPPAPWNPAADWVAKTVGCEPCRTHSVAETARALGVSQTTVREAVRKGDLVAVRPATAPKLIRIRPEDAAAWLDASTKKGGAS